MPQTIVLFICIWCSLVHQNSTRPQDLQMVEKSRFPSCPKIQSDQTCRIFTCTMTAFSNAFLTGVILYILMCVSVRIFAGSGPVLQFSAVRKIDSGDYVCIAENVAGVSTASLTLDVQCKYITENVPTCIVNFSSRPPKQRNQGRKAIKICYDCHLSKLSEVNQFEIC